MVIVLGSVWLAQQRPATQPVLVRP